MDSTLVSQILFANEKAFECIDDANKCHMLASVCKAAKENEHIINLNDRNRAELYAIRVFNCLLKHVHDSNNANTDEFSKKFIESVSTMINEQREYFRVYFTELIILDYVEIINHNTRYNTGYEIGYYNSLFINQTLLYNYKRIIEILGVDFDKELVSLRVRKIEENKESYKKIEFMLWSIDDILELHNNIQL